MILLPDQPEIAWRGLIKMDDRYTLAVHRMVRRQNRRSYASGPKPLPAPTTGPIKTEPHLTITREEFLCQTEKPMLDEPKTGTR